ncbi:SDR family oxidoreductase [Parashewanella spongiae]|uniref:SDR family oxidoreductase n=1 Tax=Parashewanella spongiae TaxID=342950 RepID=A0A3A6U337_9GAMM|nr:SDR family oxidoreductase [Parashewanella spongiae]MCL1077945.1 SDR family oxidoreductase [Parashewanella spongiae]RJY18435.1 SDR family oxidoreductase [Parashewanella spongiae]
MKRFVNKTVLVTGAASGIGRDTCLRLASEGAQVIAVDLNEPQLATLCQQIKQQGGEAHSFPCDLSLTKTVREVFENIKKQFYIDVLINNAGIAHVGTIEQTSEEDLDRLYQVNIKGIYNTISSVIPSMVQRSKGVILNLASVASCVAVADRFAYSMTKGAVLTMTYSIAKDYINQGIRCNCISPGRVHTPFVDNFLEKNYPDNQQQMFETLSKSQPIGRMAKVEEVSSLIAYLCSDEAAFITGSNFPIDGGFTTLNS